MAKKKRKPKTIGEMTNRRNEWHINPITRVKPNDKSYNRTKEKKRIRNEEAV